MAGWTGFTDEDLINIKSLPCEGIRHQSASTSTRRQKKALRESQLLHDLEVTRAKTSVYSGTCAQGISLDPSQRLSKIAQNTRLDDMTAKCSNEENCTATLIFVIDDGAKGSVEELIETDPGCANNEGHTEIQGANAECSNYVQDANIESHNDVQNAYTEASNDMQELNETEALRCKLAKEESEKLAKVQKELHRLDRLVSADVATIRGHIESVSLDFLHAQKRYNRAEKEFVEAKIDLAEKSSMKESLTEHLYAVIQCNEARKSHRLFKLMEELGIEADKCPIVLPDLPPMLSSFPSINTFHRSTTAPLPQQANHVSLNQVQDATVDSSNVVETCAENGLHS